jgi:hypothetical protein
LVLGKQPTGNFHHAGLEHLNDDEFNHPDEFSFGHLTNGNTSRGATGARFAKRKATRGCHGRD